MPYKSWRLIRSTIRPIATFQPGHYLFFFDKHRWLLCSWMKYAVLHPVTPSVFALLATSRLELHSECEECVRWMRTLHLRTYYEAIITVLWKNRQEICWHLWCDCEVQVFFPPVLEFILLSCACWLFFIFSLQRVDGESAPRPGYSWMWVTPRL